MKTGCQKKVFNLIIFLINLMIAVKNGIPHTGPNARITAMLLLQRQKTKLTTREGHNITTSQTFQLVPVDLVETTQHGWGTIATKNTISSQMANYAVISFSREPPAVLKFQMR